MKVYKGQGWARITLKTNVDLTTSTDRKILYKKPNGLIGEWLADLVDTDKLRYYADNGTFDVSGLWTVQPTFKLAGLVVFGSPYSFKIADIL